MRAGPVYVALTWIGLLCVAFALITALLDWGGLAEADDRSWPPRRALVAIALFGVVTAVVGIVGLVSEA